MIQKDSSHLATIVMSSSSCSLLSERKGAEARRQIDDPQRVAERIHAVWWVIDVAAGGRFNPDLRLTVQELFSGEVPIFIVMNKCDARKEEVECCQRDIENLCPWATAVIPVVAQAKNGPLKMLCAACGSDDIMVSAKGLYYACESCGAQRMSFQGSSGLDKIIQQTAQSLPVMVVSSFLLSQKECLQRLDRFANGMVAGCGGFAAVVGGVPLPYPDLPLLCIADCWTVYLLAWNYDIVS